MSNNNVQDNLFIELSLQEKKIKPQAASFCKKIMEEDNISPSVTAVKEGYMTEEDVAYVYELISKQENREENIYTVDIPEKTTEEEVEELFLSYVLENELIDEKALQFCAREQQRLKKLGYNMQLSALLCSTNCLSPQDICNVYKNILEDESVELIENRVAFADMGLPAVRKFNKVKARRAEVTPQEAMMEHLEEIVEKQAPQVEVVEEQAPEPSDEFDLVEAELEKEEDEFSMEDERIHEDESIQAIEVREKFAVNVDSSATMPILMEILETLKELKPKYEMSIEEDEISVDDLERKAHEEEDSEELDRELEELKHGKTRVTEKEIAKIVAKGGVLDGYHIPKISIVSDTNGAKISLVNCLIENIEFSESTFENKIDFSGSHFFNKAIFKGSIFQKDVKFSKAVFHNGADFAKTEFQSDCRFNTTGFKRFVSFNRANFKGKTIFSRSYFAKGVKFAEVTFAGGASFNDIYCDHRFYLEKCQFDQETSFSNAKFSDIADFSRSTFNSIVKFKGTAFSKWASFQYVTFKNECHFNGTYVSGDLVFKWAKFHNIINMKTLCAERNVTFNNAKLLENASFKVLDAYFGRLFITRGQLENRLDSHLREDYKIARQEYGLLKNNFREINEYDREDWAYLMEKRMERMAIKPKGLFSSMSKFFNWIALDISCGYGTKPLNIFITSLAILMIFAVSYFAFGSEFTPPNPEKGVVYQPISFANSVLLSFKTFTNASVTGWDAKANSWMNYIMMFESFFGFFVMTVLVVTFSRKVIR